MIKNDDDMATLSEIREVLEHQKQSLDSLFERYLEVLHEYQQARQQLSSKLSSGFFSLAQANFASNSGRRYGQDYYDERMRATRTIQISKHDGDSHVFTAISPVSPGRHTEVNPSAESMSSSVEKDGDPQEPDVAGAVNPIRWFGILVPPALRDAQSWFSDAVVGPIPKLVTLAQTLRQLETEIGRAQKKIRKLQKV